jgi:FMN-dependent oxidoreductase (nitrilotriacetate monooxygenase family)
MYHIGWFLGSGFGATAWDPKLDGPWVGDNIVNWSKPDMAIDLATSLERARFDFLLIQDTLQIDDGFRGSAETTLRRMLWAPKNDPMPLVPLIAARTRHIGIVPTITSTFYPPYLASRLLTTLDHVTEGRVGFNLVTSSSPLAAQNFGMELPPKELRYEMATEWVEVIRKLENSWEPGAVLADIDKAIYADHTRVHPIHHDGRYFKCRGPMNTIPGPQRNIPMFQAGNSPGGLALTAKYGDVLLGAGRDVEDMKAKCLDMEKRLRENGRDRSECKILFLVRPIVGATDAEAKEREAAMLAARWEPAAIEYMQWYIEHVSGVDLSTYDLDMSAEEALREIERGGRAISVVFQIFKGREKSTLREILATQDAQGDLGLTGSPDTVASKMDELMREVGADGYILNVPSTRLEIAQMCDGLAPVLRRRGSIRSGFEGKTFRENLHAF